MKDSFSLLTFVVAVVMSANAVPGAQQDLTARARAIHERVITLDTHNDIDPQTFTADCNYTMRLTTQVNLPKMKEGGLDASFFIVYVGQGDLTPAGYERAYRSAIGARPSRETPSSSIDRADPPCTCITLIGARRPRCYSLVIYATTCRYLEHVVACHES